MKHLGDITKIHGDAVEIVDVVTGGSPCQDLSVAGKRAGLAGERSGLFMEQIRIIKEMRDESRKRLYDAGADYNRTDVKPRYMVWENVAGAFSSNKGEDFRAVLEETAKVADKDAVIPESPGGKWSHAGCIMGNGWSIAWRLHDAQFWGVPQRRKRIALVADFGGATAPEILFERKGLSGGTAESAEKGQTVAGDAGAGIEKTGGAIAFEPGAMSRVGGHIYGDDKSGTIRANAGDNQQAVVYGIDQQGGKGMAEYAENVSPTMASDSHGTPHAVCYGISSYDSNGMKSDNPHSGIYEADTSRTLDLNGGNPGCNQGGMAVVQAAGVDTYNQTMDDEIAQPLRAADGGDSTPKVVCLEGNGSRPSHQGDGWHEGDPMYTLNSTEHHAVAVENHPADSRVKISEDGMVQTLSGRMGTGGNNVPMVMESSTWDGSQVSPTLTANNANGSQRMPDKEKFNAVIQRQTAKGLGAVCSAVDCRNGVEDENVNGSLQSRASNNTNSNNVCRVGSVVRRLTPLEAERLQGFPDNWTNIGDWVDSKGKTRKGESDSPRYKALGNSIALPFWQWMAERMMPYLPENPTMASLFDGIGGFPLVFSRCGCKPVWASEIEEFPIAVTKRRFPEE